MKQNYTISFLFFLIFLMTSCKNKESAQLTHKLDKAIAIGENQPNEALQILDSIASENLDKTNFMLYQVAKVKALRNANLPIDSVLMRKISQSANYFEKQNDAKNAAIANFYAGRAYQYKNDTETEFAYYLNAYPYAEKANDSTTMGKALFNIGCIYFDQQVYDSSQIYLNKSIPLLKNYPQSLAKAYTLIAYSNYLTQNPSAALKALDAASYLLKYPQNKPYIYEYNSLYGVSYKELKNYDEAIKYLQKNLSTETSLTNRIRSTLNLVDIYRLAQNTDSATYYARLVEPQLLSFEPKTLDDNYLLAFGYEALRDYYSLVDNKDNIIKYGKLYTQKQQQIDKENLSKKLISIEYRTAIKKITDLNKEQKNKFLAYTILISVLILITVLLVVYKHLKKNETKAILQKIDEIEALRGKLNMMKENKDQKQSF